MIRYIKEDTLIIRQIQELIAQDGQLQKELDEVVDLAEAVELVIAAGVKQGYNFTRDQVSEGLHKMQMSSDPEELSKHELLAIAGGFTFVPTAEERRK